MRGGAYIASTEKEERLERSILPMIEGMTSPGSIMEVGVRMVEYVKEASDNNIMGIFLNAMGFPQVPLPRFLGRIVIGPESSEERLRKEAIFLLEKLGRPGATSSQTSTAMVRVDQNL